MGIRGGSGRVVGLESGGEDELVAFFGAEAEDIGAANDVITVTGAFGHALAPADKGEAVDVDPAGKFGVADTRAAHVFRQQIGKRARM